MRVTGGSHRFGIRVSPNEKSLGAASCRNIVYRNGPSEVR
ncbi:hypothetical protein CBM2587_B90067 [Cupriavidus taiwanensis]|uniref:Uncharacterized protein n=1 Tax=Cupriavidus taiwanensis TaxID=164546 RepID=A0A975XGJ5_9BURK|nr:hypothetical protein CBM2587_B90067 [Cupriavidus taiwanensis]